MGWIKDSLEILTDFGRWAKRQWNAADLEKKIKAVSIDLLGVKPNLAAAERLIRLARQAGYMGDNLDSLEHRIELIRAHEESGSGGEPPRVSHYAPAPRKRGKTAAKKKAAAKKGKKAKVRSKKTYSRKIAAKRGKLKK